MTTPAIRDRGSSSLLVLITCATLALAVLGALATFANDTLDRTRAQTVADAAALAGVIDGRASSVTITSQNGGQLVSWRVGPGDGEVTVVVRVGDVTAEARASDAP